MHQEWNSVDDSAVSTTTLGSVCKSTTAVRLDTEQLSEAIFLSAPTWSSGPWLCARFGLAFMTRSTRRQSYENSSAHPTKSPSISPTRVDFQASLFRHGLKKKDHRPTTMTSILTSTLKRIRQRVKLEWMQSHVKTLSINTFWTKKAASLSRTSMATQLNSLCAQTRLTSRYGKSISISIKISGLSPTFSISTFISRANMITWQVKLKFAQASISLTTRVRAKVAKVSFNGVLSLHSIATLTNLACGPKPLRKKSTSRLWQFTTIFGSTCRVFTGCSVIHRPFTEVGLFKHSTHRTKITSNWSTSRIRSTNKSLIQSNRSISSSDK